MNLPSILKNLYKVKKLKILKRFKIIADLKNLEDFNSYLKENKNLFKELNENNKELIELFENKYSKLKEENQTNFNKLLKKDYFSEKSNFTVSFWTKRGYSEEEAKQIISKAQKKNSLNSPVVKKEDRPVLIDYYIKRGYSEEEGEKQRKLYCQKHSGWSKENYIDKGFSEEEALSKISKFQKQNALKFSKKNKENPEKYKARTETQLEYWLKKGYSEEEAKLALKKRQQTFSFDKCIERHGEQEGIKKWKDRQEKWLKNYKKQNFSKISQKLFWEIYSCLSNSYKQKNTIYFATLKDNSKDLSGKNNEYRLKLKNKVVCPDFIVLEKKKIIEFDGFYWHNVNSKMNKSREEERDSCIIESDYEVLHILEFDYIKNKEKIIEDCKKFLEI